MSKSVESPTGRVAGSGSSGLPKGWTSHPLHASLPALRRMPAAGVLALALLPLAPLPRRPTAVVAAVLVASSTPTGPSPPQRRRRIATASPAPQRGYYGATTRLLRELLLRGYYKATTRLLAIRLLPGYYQATTRPLPGYYQATTRLLPGAARAPLGQQHRSRSPARLPAPLILSPPAR